MAAVSCHPYRHFLACLGPARSVSEVTCVLRRIVDPFKSLSAVFLLCLPIFYGLGVLSMPKLLQLTRGQH